MPTREQILELIRKRPIEIARWLGYDKFTDLHNKWLQKFLFTKKDTTLQAHRESYKSTLLAWFFVFHLIIHPNETLMYMRKTDQNVADICTETANILSSGAIQEIVKELYHTELTFTRKSRSEIDTNLHTTPSGTAQISGFGINASITGRHADIVVTDDIVTIRDRVSGAEREHTKLIYQELQNVKRRGGRVINCGTPWHKEDAFSIMTEPDKWDCYQTGLMTPEEIREKRSLMSPSLFAANYELKHIADENALFQEAKWATAEETEKIYNGTAHIDAAYSGEDFTAYTIMKQDPESGKIYAFGKIWRKHVDECVPEIQALHDLYKAGSIKAEDNGDKGYLVRDLKANGFKAYTYHESMNKYIKISTYLKQNWGNIYWIEATDPNYIAQILDYTEDAQHDDAPDSAASLLREMGHNRKANTPRLPYHGGVI